jgi:hypothetical protein
MNVFFAGYLICHSRTQCVLFVNLRTRVYAVLVVTQVSACVSFSCAHACSHVYFRQTFYARLCAVGEWVGKGCWPSTDV